MKVRWAPTARKELANIWLSADSEQRRAITAAADLLDRRLRANAADEGESRSAGRRVVFEAPLGILFHVDKKRSVVRVTRVWTFKR